MAINNKRYLVAIGASSGGLPALCEFFDHALLRGVTYIITTHLDPFYKSMLSEIIQKHSGIEVCTVEHHMKIKSNMIYVMPENKTMTIANGSLLLKQRDLSVKLNMAIDIFFISLANDHLYNKIAVILSGMGKDGNEGVKKLVEKGAYVIAQKSLSAESSSMPDNIIASGYANEVLDPKDMPNAIISYLNEKNN